MRTPADVLAVLVRTDPTAPRLTSYDDSPAAAGERIELSAKVFANWVAKAANALQDEWDVGPGSRVRLVLPPHWRLAYWAFAVWSAGGTVVLTPDAGQDADVAVTVCADPGTMVSVEGERVLVTLAALARRSPVPVPVGAVDEAASLATYADRFDAWAEPSASDVALVDDAGETAYGTLLEHATAAAGQPRAPRVHTATEDGATFLRLLLAVWSAGGSLVLSRGVGDRDLGARLASEGVTLDLRAP